MDLAARLHKQCPEKSGAAFFACAIAANALVEVFNGPRENQLQHSLKSVLMVIGERIRYRTPTGNKIREFRFLLVRRWRNLHISFVSLKSMSS